MTSPIQMNLSQIAGSLTTPQQSVQTQQTATAQPSSAAQVAQATQAAAMRETNTIDKDSKRRTVQVPPRTEKRGDAPKLKTRSPRSPSEQDKEAGQGTSQDKVDLIA